MENEHLKNRTSVMQATIERLGDQIEKLTAALTKEITPEQKSRPRVLGDPRKFQ